MSNGLMGWLPGLVNAKRVKIKGDCALVLSTHGLATVDISGPPKLLANAGIVFDGIDFSLEGDLLVATGTRVEYQPDGSPRFCAGVYFFHVQHPSDPQFMQKMEVETQGVQNPKYLAVPKPVYFGVALSGVTAYVGTENKLLLLDIDDLSTTIGSLSVPGHVYSVTVHDGLAYLACGVAGLIIVDIADPEHPAQVGSFNTPGVAQHVFVEGATAYVSDTSSVQILDVGSPALPKFKGSYPLMQAIASTVKDGKAHFAAQGNGLHVVNVSNPAVPKLLAHHSPIPAHNASTVAVEVAGDKIFCANSAGGLGIIGPTGQTAQFTDQWHGVSIILIKPGLVAISGTRITDAQYKMVGGVRFVDVSNPSQPRIVRDYLPAGNNLTFGGLAVKGNHLFVACGQAGVRTLDISNLNNVSQVAIFDTPGAYGWCQRVTVAGDYLYVADGMAGLHVFRIAASGSLTLLGSFNTPSNAKEVAVGSAMAYVADGASLQIIDCANPVNPTVKGVCGAQFTQPMSVNLVGSLVYTAESYRGIRIIDVTNPASPQVRGSLPNDNRLNGGAIKAVLHVNGRKLCVASDFAGFACVDVSNPDLPKLSSRTMTPGVCFDVCLDGQYAYCADDFGGLSIVKL